VTPLVSSGVSRNFIPFVTTLPVFANDAGCTHPQDLERNGAGSIMTDLISLVEASQCCKRNVGEFGALEAQKRGGQD